MALVHHELCFGCGRTNVFGLLLEAERTGPDSVQGRCFIKQDHQGSQRGLAHEGILATALIEAMAFACGEPVHLDELELRIAATAPVGSFLAVEAQLDHREGQELRATARGKANADYVCSASGSFTAWLST
jgi:acyl-coenzyme A thioesterase PaaI-like protein